MTKSEMKVTGIFKGLKTHDVQVIPTIPHEHHERALRRQESDCADLWDLLDSVKDPEIPVLSLWDLGVLRDVQRDESGVCVTITPTYSGCPAMDVMREDILLALEQHGQAQCEVKLTLSPAWTTAWLSDEGKKQLHLWGIAPPCKGGEDQPTPSEGITCPHCQSTDTVSISEFGSTACKALFKCNCCCEPFDYFKHI